MAKSHGKSWTEAELAIVISLYCQTAFGKMHAKNPNVVAVAHNLGRSASSVALKLVNLASLDPYHQDRGVSGMSHTSELDRKVWTMYYGHWDKLGEILDLSDNTIENQETTVDLESEPKAASDTEYFRREAVRRGQAFFRNAVLSAHDLKCCITGISCQPLLRASHIIPWAMSHEHRLNPSNGLCLNSLHDAAFDRGLMTLTDDFRIMISSKLVREIQGDVFAEYFGRYDGLRVHLPRRFTPNVEFIQYHRINIYKQ